jgi:arabinogalactan oligomer/maltooligosaccharide transport system substrate-binding protein
MKKVLSTIAIAGVATLALASCGKKKEKLTIWVSESDGVKELTQQQVKAFKKLYPDVNLGKYKVVVEGVSEADAATQMIADVESGADIFCFAQDQLARLVQAKAVTEVASEVQKRLVAANDAASIAASTVAGKMYCYPLTSDNGYYMYYDKSVVAEAHLDSLEDIIADCEKANKLFCFELTSSAWYNAAFMFAKNDATGKQLCSETWTTDESGKIVSCESTFDTDNGVIALRGMQHLLKSTCHKDSSTTGEFANDAAVVISGTWGSGDAKNALGDNYAATDLPSFKVDNQTYHLGSFSGNKLMGVKPQTDAEKVAICQLLAEFLTNKDCQLERFNAKGWGPSNKEAQQNDAVKNDAALTALAAQSAYATPQGQIHGSWWDIAKTYASAAKEAAADDATALKAGLDAYKKAVDGLFQMSEAEKRAWSVIGVGGDWNTDYTMIETGENTNVWVSEQAFTFEENAEFKCRQGKNWDVNVGDNGNNFKVTTAGTYKVKLTWTGDASTSTIELIAA